jgi:hypothetical protein
MKCTDCQESGQRSKVYECYTMCLPMGGRQVFYDEDGKRHECNRDKSYTVYRCDKGHTFSMPV